jgi:sugar phosphate isomerase/epimerase
LKISVMLYSFSRAFASGDLLLDDALNCCGEAGADGVEPMAGLAGDPSVEEISALLAKYGLATACYDVSADLIQDDEDGRRQALDHLSHHIRRAASIGSRIVLIVPGGLRDGIDRPLAMTRAAEGIRAVIPAAAELGVTLTVEQMGSPAALCTRGEHMRAIVEAVDSPHFGLTYDPGNFYLTGEDCVKPLPDLLPWVRHVHFKDIRLKADGWISVPLGTGEVPLDGVYRVLAEGGYDGYISVEYEGSEDPCPAVQTGIEYVRGLIGR